MSVKRNLMRILMMFMVLFQVITCVTYGVEEGSEEGTAYTTYTGTEGQSVEISKKIKGETSSYAPGESMEYELRVTNNSTTNKLEIPVIDEFSEIKTKIMKEDGSTVTGKAYSETIVTGVLEGNSTAQDKTGLEAYSNNSLENENMNINARLSPGATAVYTIKAKVNRFAVGDIVNKATAGNDPTTILIEPVAINLTSSLDLLVNNDNTDYYIHKGSSDKITYSITITNNGDDWAKNIRIKDDILAVAGEALDGTTISKVFSSWSFTSKSTGGSSIRKSLEDEANSDKNFENTEGKQDEILDAYMDIEKGESVTIEITGTLIDPKSDRSKIVNSNLINTAILYKGTEEGEKEEREIKDYAYPKSPKLSISKIAEKINGSARTNKVLYTITVKNTGEGYANDIQVIDDLGSITLNEEGKTTVFSKAEIVDVVIATNELGTYSSLSSLSNSDLANNKLEDELVDIKPGGSITYTVKGIVAEKQGKSGTVKNTVELKSDKGFKINEAVNTITLGVGSGSGAMLSVEKTASVTTLYPNNTVVYTIAITNHGAAPASNIVIKDVVEEFDPNKYGDEKTLGNDGDKTVINGTWEDEIGYKGNLSDIELADPFIYWEILSAKIDGNDITDDLKITVKNNQLKGSKIEWQGDNVLAKDKTMIMEIEATPNKFLLPGNLTNRVNVTWGGTISGETITEGNLETSYTNTIYVSGSSNAYRYFYEAPAESANDYTEPSKIIYTYKPEQRISYMIKTPTAVYPSNNVLINETLLGETVNGDKEFIFEPGFKVELIVKKDSTPVKKIKKIGELPNLEMDTIAGNQVVCIITGKIRKGIVGTIYNGFTPHSWQSSNEKTLTTVVPNLSIKKIFLGEEYSSFGADKSTTDHYVSGKDIWMKIIVTNDSDINANDIVIQDELGDITNGFIKDSIEIIKISDASGEIAKTPENTEITNGNIKAKIDVGKKSTVEYLIKARVSEDASGTLTTSPGIYREVVTRDSEGNITNTTYVELNKITATIKGYYLGTLELEKLIIEYLDENKNPAENQNGYQSNGYVKYGMIVKNPDEGNVNIDLTDDLVGIKTNIMNDAGSIEEGSAFTEGSLSITKKDLEGKNSEIIQSEIDITDGKINDEGRLIPTKSQLVYEIIGKVNPKAIERFRNTAKVKLGDEEIEVHSPYSYPLPPAVTITKTAIEDGGSETDKYTAPPTGNDPNIIYTVKVENPTNNHALNLRVQDILDQVKVETVNGTTSAFDMATCKIWVTDSSGVTSEMITKNNAEAKAITGENLSDIINMKPNSQVTYRIEIQTIPKASGIIGGDAEVVDVATGEVVVHDDAPVTRDIENPKLDAEMYIKVIDDNKIYEATYEQGGEVTYYLDITNVGDTDLTDVEIEHLLKDIKAKLLNGTTGEVFNSLTITLETTDLSDGGKKPISSIQLEKGKTLTYKIIAQVKEEASGIIEPTAKVSSRIAGEIIDDLKVTFTPLPPDMKLEKTVISSPKNGEYYQAGETIKYKLIAKNTGPVHLANVSLIDEVTALKGRRSGTTEEIDLFRSWTYEVEEEFDGSPLIKLNKSLIKSGGKENIRLENVVLLKGNQNRIVITIEGEVNEEVNDIVTNTFSAVAKGAGEDGGDYKPKDASVDVDVKTVSINEGMLDITKRAMKDTVKVGEPVEYEIIIENNTEDTTNSTFEDIYLKDIIPAGFRYLKGSSEHIFTKANGTEEVYTDNPTQTNSLKYQLPDMEPGDKYTIRYILTPGIGVTFGKYTNQAGVKFDDGSDASDTVSASVSIEADALFDTASIIGKVFFDHNKNGHQDEDYHEAGIPGVRLISPRGITAVTDRFGRYHLPDMWVYNKLGQVAEVKLDITTLPANTKVISENPKIKRVSSAALTKFNFSVVVEDDKFAVDTTRIYLEKGAIWMVNDFVEIDQELSLNFPERIVVKDNKLTEAIDFNIDINYGEFIDKYELAIYPQNDRGLKQPIKVFSGRELVDGTTITWEDMDMNKDLVAGRELKVRLRVWDKNGRMDKTEIGHIDMVRRIPILDLFNYETQNTVELLVKNINLNTSIVRIVGDGLEGVNTVTIKDDEYSVDDNEFLGIRYIPSGKNILPVKVKYDDGREEEYELITNYKDTYYIGTAIIDLNFGKYHIDGNEEILQVDNPYGANYYEDKIYREGRLAVFGKGRYKDKLRFTTYIDTKTRDIKAMFDHVFDKDDQTVFERVQDTDTYYYPTYGDKSYVYRHVDTDGDIYFKAEYEDSYLMWGNYETEIDKSKYINYNRSLYGAKLDYVSTNKTDYGDEDRLIAFMSKPYSLFGHDEFLGTGGSLYFLKNNDVLNGSEKVYIKVVNSLTDRTEKTIDLVEGRDYEFDPYQGRVILNKPLKTNAANIDDEIIQSGASGDYYNYLVVDYEYIPSTDEGLSEKDYGVTFEKFLGKHLGLGGTYIKENRDGTDYRLKGAELTIKFTENSYIKGGVSESEGTQSNNSFVSLDGGLTFDKSGLDDPGEITGQAYEAMAVINLGDIAPNLFGSFGNELTGWYEQKDAGYSFASDLEDTYIESYGSRLTLRHSDRIKSSLKYEEYEERDGINKIKGKVIDKYKAVTAEVEYLLTDKLSTSFAYKYIKEMIDVDGNDEMLAANIIGMRLEYEANEDLTLYLEGQGTVSRDDGYEVNNRVTVGFDADITEDLSINASTSVGTRGNYSELGLDYDLTDNYSIYLGATTDGEEDQDDLTFGQRMKINDKVEIYQESQILKEDGKLGRADNYGIDYDYNDDLTIGGSFQYGKIELPDDKGEARRKAFSLYANYDTFNFDWRSKLEYREDKEDGQSEKTKQYLTTNYFDYIRNEEISFGGKFNYAYTDDETENETHKFIEGSIGMAYRPIENDKLNFLARYTFILNDDPNDGESLKAHIAEFEAICDATERLDLGIKLAYRDEEEGFIRESGREFIMDNSMYLIGLRANYIVMNDWDVYLEYHWLIDRHSHDVRDGAIVGIYKNLHTNLKVGGGYNFSGFSSDLSEEDYEAHGWFINIVGRF